MLGDAGPLKSVFFEVYVGHIHGGPPVCSPLGLFGRPWHIGFSAPDEAPGSPVDENNPNESCGVFFMWDLKKKIFSVQTLLWFVLCRTSTFVVENSRESVQRQQAVVERCLLWDRYKFLQKLFTGFESREHITKRVIVSKYIPLFTQNSVGLLVGAAS